MPLIKTWSLRLHRWLALLFALPLLVVLGTGLVLSFEPWLTVRAVEAESLTLAKVQELLGRHDPDGQARGLAYRSYDGTLTIGSGRGGGKVVDVLSGQVLQEPSAMARLFVTMRRMHETLLLGAGWVVISSTVVMLMLAVFGILVGWPQLSNTLRGWHKMAAWIFLPLIVLSSLTGLFLAWGITFNGPPSGRTPSEGGGAVPLADAVRIVSDGHDLSRLVWITPQGGRLLARIVEDGEYRVYAVTRDGTVAMARNWPRLWHEGNFAGVWSAMMNVVLSIVMVGLLVTGVWLWVRRQLVRRGRGMRRLTGAH